MWGMNPFSMTGPWHSLLSRLSIAMLALVVLSLGGLAASGQLPPHSGWEPSDFSSSLGQTFAAPYSGVGGKGGAAPAGGFKPFTAYGVDARVGFGGVGFDVATALAQKINLRVGGDFFSYSDTFVEQQANVNAALQLQTGHASLDWFPFGNGFRVSPMVVFGNNNHVRATVLVPAGTTVTLSGSDYVSSATDPLRGNGSVDFRKTSPGLTVGWGNIVPRSGARWSFPFELGFYYVGQPTLKVAFTGSACDPTQPAAIGCQSVDTDSDFQASLAAFKARNDNNLSYASFFPVLSTGVGFRF